MIRALAEEAVLLLAPFALFAVILVLTRRNVIAPQSWSGRAFWLLLAGLGLVFASFAYEGLFASRHMGAFVPTHIENGEVVPGEFR